MSGNFRTSTPAEKRTFRDRPLQQERHRHKDPPLQQKTQNLCDKQPRSTKAPHSPVFELVYHSFSCSISVSVRLVGIMARPFQVSENLNVVAPGSLQHPMHEVHASASSLRKRSSTHRSDTTHTLAK